MQRPAEKGDLALERNAAGQSANRLVDDRLKNRSGDVLAPGALVDQRHDVGLGEDAAARGDGVERRVSLCQRVEPRRVRLQERRHLVDEGARPARARLVHAQLHALAQTEDFGVLAAELDRHVRLGRDGHQRPRRRHHLLEKRQPQHVGNRQRAGTSDRPAHLQPRVTLRQIRQDRRERLTNGRAMPLVDGVDDLAVGRAQDCLGSGRTDVEAQRASCGALHADAPSSN